ncbi:MAG: hypothetical protein HXY34_00470 [Candidatus Thorarchaeota archaeon]|nr:hypothetical protein [Candidatus Thorarchaeota archaeon]
MEEDDVYEDTDEDLESEELEDTAGTDTQVVASGVGGLQAFLQDPWPKVTFALTLFGLALVLLTPPAIWHTWSYSLLGAYFVLILAAVGDVLSLQTWYGVRGSRLKYGGLTTLILVSGAALVGLLDTFAWVLAGVSILPGNTVSLLGLSSTIVVFCLYSLFIMQRTITGEKR